MEFTKTDLSIAVGMSIAIILLNFMLPPMGLVDNQTSESEIPELSINSDRFDFAGAFPGSPESVMSGNVNISNLGNYQEPLPNDHALTLINNSDGTFTVRLDDYYGTTSYENTTISEGGEYFLESGTDKRVQGKWFAEDRISYEYIEADDYGGITGQLRYIADIFVWGFGTIITIFTNAFGALYDIIVFMMGLANWILSTYSGLVTNANDWASIVLAIPGIMLMYELGKVVAIIVDILWIG